jgi:hypothetical protein
MPFSPHLIVFLLPPENPYMITTLDGSKSQTRIEFDRLDAVIWCVGYPMIVAWNPSGQKTLGSLFAHGGNDG